MGEIVQLPDFVVRKIAAGEIIERPSSVLKELIENSLDADSSEIVIFLEGGGKRLISVMDDGYGISGDDLLNSVKRYSTSKIRSIEDLYTVKSYGFRGEALYSISSVSKFTIVSRKRGSEIGKELYIEGGIFKSFSDVGAPEGTKVSVRDLFFNLPVRKKFLKNDRTELLNCIKTILNYSLVRTDVHFKVFSERKEYLNLPPDDLNGRIKKLFPTVDESILNFEYENPLGKVYGVVSVDERIKKSGYLFINKRPVRNKAILKFLKSTLGNKFFIVFLELPEYFVDHNIHPAKLEVKLKRESSVLDLLKKGFENIFYLEQENQKKVFTLSQNRVKYSENRSIEILGDIENTFLVVYLGGDLFLIDKHIMHERINYEILKRDLDKSGRIVSKKVEKPIKINVSSIQKEEIKLKREILYKAGFLYEEIEDSILIYEIPKYVNEEDAVKLFFDILQDDADETLEKLLSDLACSRSIKAGDPVTSVEAKIMLKNWLETDNPNLCPHGRPIYYRLSLTEVKKILGRG
ncbi:DNA mismatch repair endonuclease MutL [Persephonella sp.]